MEKAEVSNFRERWKNERTMNELPDLNVEFPLTEEKREITGTEFKNAKERFQEHFCCPDTNGL